MTKLLASDGASSDRFGWSVAVSGDTVVVGARDHDDNGSNSGSSYVFQRDEGGADAWGEVTKLLASDGGSLDNFGISVAVSGDTAVVGARLDDDNGDESGSAYVFDLNLLVPVSIDIKPSDSEELNAVNSRSRGTIPVAILSTESFSAVTQIDQNTLTFGKSGSE